LELRYNKAAMNKPNKSFEVHAYVDSKYKHLLEEYEENHGINGLDHLWSLESKDEVDDLFEDYL
jgi:hypothetical protein